MEDYNLQYMKYFVENCEKNDTVETIKPIVMKYCRKAASEWLWTKNI